MNNRGSITVFLCLMIIAMVSLSVAAIQVVEHHMAKSKGAMTVKSAMSGIDARYNSYIFENYHILLFDKGCNGQGEAALELKLIEDIEYNLGDGFSLEQLAVTDYELIMEDNCNAFKEQIGDYCQYAMIEYGANSILSSTGGQDGTMADYIIQDMEDVKSGNVTDSEYIATTEEREEEAFENPWADVEDPREFTEDLTPDGILAIVAPEDMVISGEKVDLTKTPSVENKVNNVMELVVDNDFDDIDRLRDDIGWLDSWKEELVESGVSVAYAATVFNCATDTVQEDTVFDFELEYLVGGRASDKENLRNVVHKIIAIRLPVNYSYLVGNTTKMAEISKISVPLSISLLVPEPILRYLIAGCWAYVEAVFDVKCLLDGQKQDFFKNSSNWKTDINDLEKSINLEGENSDTGLTYKDYILILLALDMEAGYYRMLDIIELNTCQHYGEFDMSNGAVGFSLDAKISYGNKSFYYRENMGY